MRGLSPRRRQAAPRKALDPSSVLPGPGPCAYRVVPTSGSATNWGEGRSARAEATSQIPRPTRTPPTTSDRVSDSPFNRHTQPDPEERGQERQGRQPTRRINPQKSEPEREAQSRREKPLKQQSSNRLDREVIGRETLQRRTHSKKDGHGDRRLREQKRERRNTWERELLSNRLHPERHTREQHNRVAQHLRGAIDRTGGLERAAKKDHHASSRGQQAQHAPTAHVLSQDEPGQRGDHQGMDVDENGGPCPPGSARFPTETTRSGPG